MRTHWLSKWTVSRQSPPPPSFFFHDPHPPPPPLSLSPPCYLGIPLVLPPTSFLLFLCFPGKLHPPTPPPPPFSDQYFMVSSSPILPFLPLMAKRDRPLTLSSEARAMSVTVLPFANSSPTGLCSDTATDGNPATSGVPTAESPPRDRRHPATSGVPTATCLPQNRLGPATRSLPTAISPTGRRTKTRGR